MKKIKKLSIMLAVVIVLVSMTACTKNEKESVISDEPVASVETSISTEEPTASVEEVVNDGTDDWEFVNERPEDISAEETVAAKLVAVFEKEAENTADVLTLAHALAGGDEPLQVDVEVAEISEGYLNGFNKDITGFSNGAVIAPFIGSIPFVAYVFETEDTEALSKLLEESADLRWNICTEADELKIAVSGNRVFIVMAPWTF